MRVVMAKWPHHPHWRFEATHLGADAHGDWLGVPAGTAMSRPGASYVAPTDQVVLVPAPGDDLLRGWVATFHGAGGPLDTYVDMTTAPTWDHTGDVPVVHAVDLDLDVIRGPTGRVWVDDEDELARHRVELDYPDEIVALAVATAERVAAAVTAREAPYDGSAARWLARVAPT